MIITDEVKSRLYSLYNIPITITIQLNRKHILFGLVYSHFAHIQRQVIDYINHIILIGKLSISKFKYGKTKNVYLIFESELDIRYNTLTYQ